MPNVAELAYLSYLADEELDLQRSIQTFRDYHAGDQDSFLTDRLREFLNITNLSVDFRMNVCRPVVSAIIERLHVTGFSINDDTQGRFAQATATLNHLDILQNGAHESTVRDGESFVIVSWDDTRRAARLTAHPRYVSTEAGGDGFGCKAHYAGDDPAQEMLYASKRWIETLAGGDARDRLTLYFPDRVEKYEVKGRVPVQLNLPDEPWPIPWVVPIGRSGAGMPLGIPVVHLTQPALRSELHDAIFMQNAINKTLSDLLAEADLSAFRIMLFHGDIPTTDGKALAADRSNAPKVRPGAAFWSNSDAFGVDTVDGADVSPLVRMLDQLLMWTAVVTDTPVSRFQFTGQIAAEGTLKQQNDTLLAKVKNRQMLFGNAWERCMELARRLDNAYGVGSHDETLDFSAQWADPQTRNGLERAQELQIKHDSLGIPIQQIWLEAGYTQQETEAMLAMRENELAMQMRVAATDLSSPVNP